MRRVSSVTNQPYLTPGLSLRPGQPRQRGLGSATASGWDLNLLADDIHPAVRVQETTAQCSRSTVAC